MANWTDLLKAAAIILAAVAVWWLLAAAIDWLRDWLQALNIRKHQYAGRHVSPGGEPLPVLGGQQRPSWWPWGTRDDQWDGDHRDGLDVIEAVEAANKNVPGPGQAPVPELAPRDLLPTGSGYSREDVPGSRAQAAEQSGSTFSAGHGPGYFHDDVPTDVVPAVQMTDGTYVGLKGTIPANLPRPQDAKADTWEMAAPGRTTGPGQPDDTDLSRPGVPYHGHQSENTATGPGQPDDTVYDITPYPRAGRPAWAPPPRRETTWVDDLVHRVMTAPISEVRAAVASPNVELHLWGWQQRRAIEAS
jgi:hypothetical protein